MKIAHVVSTFPPRVGGMGQVCLEEAKRLADTGHDITVFTSKYEDSIADAAWKFKVVYLNSLIKTAAAAFVPQLCWLLRGFNIVHLHYPFYGGLKFVWWAKIFNKQKFVVTYHMDARVGWLFRPLQIIHDLILSPIIFRNAEKVLIVGKNFFLKSRMRRHVPETKMIELKNGVDLDVFKPEEVEAATVIPAHAGIQFHKNKKLILFVGNLLPLKRLDILIEAMKNISDPQAVLVIVGGRYDEEKYRKIVKINNLENKVFFAGSCDDKNLLNKYYNSAAVVAVPSDFESFSLVALEAMAAGAVVAARDLPALRDLIADGQNGFLINSDAPEVWAKKLEEILSAENLSEKIKGQAIETARTYGWQEHLKQLENVYKGI